MNCNDWMKKEFHIELGTLVALNLSSHDDSHGPTFECKEARIKLGVIMIHMLKLDAQDVATAFEVLDEHLKTCTCHDQGKSQELGGAGEQDKRLITDALQCVEEAVAHLRKVSAVDIGEYSHLTNVARVALRDLNKKVSQKD